MLQNYGCKQKSVSISLDLKDQIISEHGIEDFYWPISYSELQTFGHNLQHKLAAILQNHKNVEIALPYKVAMKNYASLCCSLYQGDLLRIRAKQDHIELCAPEDWLVWPYTQIEKPPHEAALILASLKNNEYKKNFIKKLYGRARRIRLLYKKFTLSFSGLSFDGLKLSPSIENFKKDIISTTRTDLITEHAKVVDEEVYLCSSRRWFSPVTEKEYHSERTGRDVHLEEAILEAVHSLYESHNVEFKAYAKNYLAQVLTDLAAVIRVHLKRLEKRTDLPSKLWTGTGGNIWDLMLRYTVLRKNGTVVAHDHGGGKDHVKESMIGWVELLGCTCFMTYGERQAEEFRSVAHEWPVMDKSLPKIDFVRKDENVQNFAGHSRSLETGFPIKNILVLSALYPNDSGRVQPLFPNLPYVDWQARLVTHLMSWQYNVYFKPHPESRSDPPDAFSTKLGAKIIHGLYEEMNVKPDLVIFDSTRTSLFRQVLSTNIPVVIINFKTANWYPWAKKLIESRCIIIDADFDKDNRMQVDWCELKTGLQQALKKANNQIFYS